MPGFVVFCDLQRGEKGSGPNNKLLSYGICCRIGFDFISCKEKSSKTLVPFINNLASSSGQIVTQQRIERLFQIFLISLPRPGIELFYYLP